MPSVCLSVSLSVSRNQSLEKQSVKGKKRVYSGRFVMRKDEERRKEAKGFINTGKCQDARRRPIYTTTVEEEMRAK